MQTDAKGGIQFKVPLKGTVDRPSELRVELSYRDPDGQTHTRAASQVVWPANVVVGLRAPSWVANGQPLQIQAVALDANGKPLANQKISVGARQIQTLSTRKRLVGGFYAYEHQRQLKDLGELCSGKTDAMGLMRCEIKLNQGGQVELLGSAADEGGRTARAARSLWVTRAGELWFAQDNDDRIDVIPERRRYEPGETARFQVRMPYREATALITVAPERTVCEPGSPMNVPVAVPPDEIVCEPWSPMVPLMSAPPLEMLTVPPPETIAPLTTAPAETFTIWPFDTSAEVRVWPEPRFIWVITTPVSCGSMPIEMTEKTSFE